MTAAHILGGLLFAAIALGLQAGAIAVAYEAIAYATGVVPTISGITASQLLQHPHWMSLGFLVIGIVIGGLTVHFTHWTP